MGVELISTLIVGIVIARIALVAGGWAGVGMSEQAWRLMQVGVAVNAGWHEWAGVAVGTGGGGYQRWC